MKQQTINVDDNLIVQFTVKELIELKAHLGKGSFDFVSPIISFMENKILDAHNMSASSTDPAPPIGGGGGSAKPPKSE